ncbi:MAG: NDP-mannose synthase [Thermoleophilaceae bacterium]|nr:NDP-mannose synthase [Thermoleophilaceae bacterium]MEA2408649.1 NDP-mannose synthase [Thermoleophilaceae bacterium]
MSKHAVILAGGKGSRLGPYTTVLPKPLMPLGDRAILDIVVRQLRDNGFGPLTIAVGYLAHIIRAVLGDGDSHGVEIRYHVEEQPLGTAGPFATIEGLDDSSFLAMNGDILTTLDYAAFFEEHERSGNAMTIATHTRTVRTNYGVLHVDESADGAIRPVHGYEEKPEIAYTVSMGVYALDPVVIEHIPEGRFDIPDLVLALIAAGLPVGAYPFDGYWLDIGRHDDYEQALQDYEDILPRLLRQEELPFSPTGPEAEA